MSLQFSRLPSRVEVRRLTEVLMLSALAFAITSAMSDRTNHQILILFVFPILLSANRGGHFWGFLATFLAVAGAAWLLPPEESFRIGSPPDIVRWILLGLAGTAISLLCEGNRRLAAGTRQAQRLRVEMEREQAFEALRKERDFTSAILETLGTLVVVLDRKGKVLRFNRACELATGFRRDEVEGRLFYERLIPVDERPAVREVFRQLQTGQMPSQYENHWLTKDGATRLFAWANTALLDEAGGIRFIIGTGVDITDQRRNESRLRRLQESGMLGVCNWRMDGAISDANEKFLAMTGYSREDLQKDRVRWAEMTPPEFRELDAQALRELKERGVDTPYEKEFIRKNGTRIPVLIGAAVYDESPDEGVAFVLDLSDRNLAHDSLRESEERFRALADNISQLAWMADDKGGIFWYNRRWYEYTGTTLGEIEGWGWKKVHHPDHLERVVEKFGRCLANGEPWEDTFPLRGGNGEWRWFLSRALPIRDARDRITRWFGTNTDITDEMRVQEELRKTETALRAALRARDEFLSIASHELKTPLSTLKLQAQLMIRSIELGRPDAYTPEKVTRMAYQTDRQVARLVRLVDDMLDVSRIETGRLRITAQKAVFCEIVTDVVERLRAEMTSAGTTPIVECLEPIEGIWDRFRMEQVVTNLLTNAMRYGKGKPVRIRLERAGSLSLRLSVKDEGMGISAENQKRIFDRFERAVSSHEITGLGLGLFITQQIVRLHGGSIWVESELGQGSTFFVELPVRREEWVKESD